MAAMDILVIGAGYAGLITAACFASAGNTVYVYDKDREKLEKIKQMETPFYEEMLSDMLSKASGNLIVSDLKSGFEKADVVFVCVGTPCKEDNSIDLSQIHSACDELAGLIKNSDNRKIIAIKSTVIPGTAEELVGRIEKASGKKYPDDFGIVSNPEFLRQGNAIDDFLHNNRIIIGSENREDAEKIKKIYAPFNRPAVIVSSRTAEMAKYVNNCLSSAKISFINEMGLIAKKQGVDINEVSEALGLKIGQGGFPLKAGCGFGGGCLEKDLKAFIEMSEKYGVEPHMLAAALKINDHLPKLMVKRLEDKLGGLENRKIGILGLAFKKGTDGTNNSRSTPLISELKKKNARITAFDPKARIPGIDFSENAQKLVDESDAVVIVSDWDEFAALDYGDKIVIDGRNVVPKEKRGKNYEGACWP